MITKKRAIAKSLSYRLVCSTETFFVSYAVARLVISPSKTAGIIAGALFCIKLVTYYLHERLWCKIKWGLELDKLKNIG